MTEVFFELPNSPIRGIPLLAGNKRLHFGMVEVGCKPTRKRGQLKGARELLYKYWADTYRKTHQIEWRPQVYRALAHYDPSRAPPLDYQRADIDVVLFYQFISGRMLEAMTAEDKRDIFNCVSSQNKRRNLLEDILLSRDAEKLHRLIVAGGNDPKISAIRGKMAEILALKDLEATLPFGMSLYRNQDIQYFNRRYDNGTEVDGIQIFYDEQTYIEQIENLRTQEHLMVRDRWH